MDTPRHDGTPFLIEVTPRPGKYELCELKLIYKLDFQTTFMVRVENLKLNTHSFHKIIPSNLECNKDD